jgi:hypothetical protein
LERRGGSLPRDTEVVVTPTSALISALPWALAVAGLALPMIGSGFIGWPFAAVWLVVLLVLWWARPLAHADRATRVVGGLAAVFALALLGTFGGFYLVPAVIAWLALVIAGSRARPDFRS